MKKFSKVRYLEINGLLDQKFNFVSNEYEKSLLHQFRSIVSLLWKVIFCLKLYVGTLFPKDALNQLYIGKLLSAFETGLINDFPIILTLSL